MMVKCFNRLAYKFVGLLYWTSISMGNDILRHQQSVSFNNTLVSSQNRFQLGIYCPGDDSGKCYLSIWFYQIPKMYPAWIGNRDRPVNQTSSFLRIASDGNLVLVDEEETIFWSTNIRNLPTRSTVAQLLDTGNLVLWDSKGGKILWESFDHPSHVQISGMKLGLDLRTCLNRKLTSWRSSEDPSPGEYSLSIELFHGVPQALMWKGASKYSRSGIWNGKNIGALVVRSDFPMTQELVVNQEEVYFRFQNKDNLSWVMFSVYYSGEARVLQYNTNSHDLRLIRAVPQDACGVYGVCGANSICNISDAWICSCFTGYSPKTSNEWDTGIWSGGCTRKTPFSCIKEDGFEEIQNLKMPDLLNIWINHSMSLEECRAECLNNCSCTAYTNKYITGGGRGCVLWFGDLLDARILSESSDQKLYVRALASELDLGTKKSSKTILMTVLKISASLLLIIFALLVIWKRRFHRKGEKQIRSDEDLGIPSFDYDTLVKATGNFSLMNKIGEGGFGHVFKGTLSNGQEIAVKRLSKISLHGLEELKNEVMLIAKLQHRSLLQLLGYSINGEDKILIYEYMSNGSLDSYIFGGTNNPKRHLLDWRRCFSIITGIASGLRYLHQDSRLRIIHRDLKASNVLLDSEMNPKISDFGTARMFQEDQLATTTRRVVGTYGYMAPEYAISGVISAKSDVYSFGVLVLEMISGEQMSHFRNQENDYSLIGHAWHLWSNGKASELIDPVIGDPCSIPEVIRCIQIGLLGVQQRPEDRPTISSILQMLNNEDARVPQPKRPGLHSEMWFNNTTEHLPDKLGYSEKWFNTETEHLSDEIVLTPSEEHELTEGR